MHSNVSLTLLHFVFGILSLQDPRHFVYGSESVESHVQRADMNHSLSTSRKLQLYNRHSKQHLRILPGQRIDAKGDDGDQYARVIIRTERFDGVTIQGESTGYYLCMNKRGLMIGRKRLKTGGSVTCVFTETINDSYTEFRPVQKTDWFLCFTRDGNPRRTDRCRPNSPSVQFLKRPLPENSQTEPNKKDIQILFDYIKSIKLKPGNS